MFGQNKVEKADGGDGYTLRVVQPGPWLTLQGEGPFAGDPAVFLRLHGCPLRCFFCDTQFDQDDNPVLRVDEIVEQIEKAKGDSPTKLLVVTGGEPVRWNLTPLVTVMASRGWTIQVETSGILWQDALLDTVIVCSPKTPRIHPKILEHAHAFKYVIRCGDVDEEDGLPFTNTQDEDGPVSRLARPIPGSVAAIYLSPMDEYDDIKNQVNRDEVARISMRYGYRAGLQLHKIFNLA